MGSLNLHLRAWGLSTRISPHVNDSLCMVMWECIKIEGFPPRICPRVLIMGEICQSTQRNKKFSCLLIGEGSEHRPFQIWGSCHKADRLSGGAEKQSTHRPCTCIKKWTFCFMFFFFFFVHEIYKKKVLKTKRPRWQSCWDPLNFRSYLDIFGQVIDLKIQRAQSVDSLCLRWWH